MRAERESGQEQDGFALAELLERDVAHAAPPRTIASATRNARTVSLTSCDAHDVGAEGDGEHGGRQRALEPLGRILGSAQRADEALARGADEHRGTQGAQPRDGAQQREVVLHVLAEADAGIDADPLLRNRRRTPPPRSARGGTRAPRPTTSS